MAPERQRCGWCIAGDHEHCVVVIEMGTHRERRNQPPVSYLWRCGCWCRDPDGSARADTLQKAEGAGTGMTGPRRRGLDQPGDTPTRLSLAPPVVAGP